MRKLFKTLFCLPILTLLLSSFCFASLIYQDFEENNGSGTYGWGANGATVDFSGGDDPVHSGTRCWKVTSDYPNNWGGSYVAAQVQTWDTDFEPDRNDRLIFWVYALPHENSEHLDNNVAVTFYDRDNYNAEPGFEIWTTKAAKYGEWTKLTVLFSQLPRDFNLARIDKLKFISYNAGTYYFDDIQVVSQDRVYQSFEPIIYEQDFTGEEYEKYGWAWFGEVDLFVDDLIVFEGEQSWMLDVLDYFGGTGIKSQERSYVSLDPEPGHIQSPWHVDLLGVWDDTLSLEEAIAASEYDRITFWVQGLPENGLDNDMGVQLFDHDYWIESFDPAVPANPFVIWPDKPYVYGEWTRFTVLFDELKSDDPAEPRFNLQNLNKIQFQQYWRGRYFFDDIRATKPFPEIDKTALVDDETVQWEAIDGADLYTVQISKGSPNGPWVTVYEGAATSYPLNALSPTWIRVSWKEQADPLSHPIPYQSDWSDVAYYVPAPVLIDHAALKQGAVEWTDLPQADRYEVEQAPDKRGPWALIYSGPQTTLSSVNGTWYRARAVIEESGEVVDVSPWSPVQSFTPWAGYLKAAGPYIYEQDGAGDKITLRGVNLGNYLLIEPWMTGISVSDPERTADDWNIRDTLVERFGSTEAARLLDLYQDAYIQEEDMDNILRMGANLVRLPIYYRAVREIDEATGAWAAGTTFDFAKIDRVVDWCADRGIYVLLDLHGAPGAQSKEFHSGRISVEDPAEEGFYHKLFDPGDDTYRQRTKELWQALADHYKDNTMVMGYDLLNEPFGVLDEHYYPVRQDGYDALWSLYDMLYDAIRAIDPKHIIVMEGVPSDKDWNTLPNPADVHWQNVVYQFHYYGFKFNEEGEIDGILDLEEQELYLVSGNDPDCELSPADSKFCGKVLYSKQDEYNVPVLIGEFNGFNIRAIWDLYIKTFNNLDWNWTMWSYKHHPKRQEWGLYTHMGYQGEDPDVTLDDALTLEEKFEQYDTRYHHAPNATLVKVVSDYFEQAQIISQPAEAGRTANAVNRKWYKVPFDKIFQKTPVLIAGIETYDGPNTSGIRIKRLNKKGFRVKIEEERSGDPETWHRTEVVGYFAIETGTILSSSGQVLGEAGTETVYQKNGSQWHTVHLQNEYVDPVVFMQMTTFHGRQPSHIRIRNIGPNAFEYQIEEWDYLNQKHLLEKISYVVMEQGSHELTNGKAVEVGTVNADHNWLTVPYATDFAEAPVTISQCQTVQEATAVITRERNISAGSFEVKLQEEEGADGIHAMENVAYIAIEE
jgi:hypothetical protein